MGEPDLPARLAAYIRAQNLVLPGAEVVVGVSGGPDSTALLHALAELAPREDMGWKLHVAHLNHQLRGEHSDADAEFVRQAARRLALPCTIGKAAFHNAGGPSAAPGLEETARLRRYEFLERVCLQCDADVLAVGHHADDNAETILHHIARGTGLRGLRGMMPMRPLGPGSRVRLVRPMLGCRRTEIMDFLDRRRIAYRVDASNQSLTHTRNRIRHEVLPLLGESINPQATEALLRLGEQARWAEDFVHEVASRSLEAATVRRTEEELILARHALAERPRIIQFEVIRQAVAGFGLGERSVGFVHLASVSDLLAGARRSATVELPGGMRVRRDADHLTFTATTPEDDGPPLPELPVAIPGATVIPGTAWVIETQVAPTSPDTAHVPWPTGPGQERLDFDRLTLPLVVRGARAGDRFVPLGAPGHKKVADFFVDQKIPPQQRRRTPILCDRSGPLWVIPYRIDERVKVTDRTTRLLMVAARS
ncbi:MAG: tRNA lysidine(34) synthetase TilS [Phycisphaerales bacterium]|nr:MAG: tRNA lysidine(34) synthetase TilS [Phycisphaerales bacterium]